MSHFHIYRPVASAFPVGYGAGGQRVVKPARVYTKVIVTLSELPFVSDRVRKSCVSPRARLGAPAREFTRLFLTPFEP